MPSLRSGVLIAAIGTLGACERANPADEAPAARPTAIAPPAKTLPPPPAPVKAPEPPKPAISVMPEAPSRERPAPAPVKRTTSAQRWWAALNTSQRKDITSVCKARKLDPCIGLLPEPKGAVPGPGQRIATILRGFDDGDREQVDEFCYRNYPHAGCDTPLVIAFDAQPIELVPAAGETFSFKAGAPVASDWPTAKTPWLALDRDGDGAIRSGAELFGDATALSGGGTATNGFAALADLDANGDGVIDRHDPAFASLLLWTDRNGDRTSSPSELRAASDVLIAIPVTHATDARCDARGNCEGERAPLVWRDAIGAVHTGAIVDLYLAEH